MTLKLRAYIKKTVLLSTDLLLVLIAFPTALYLRLEPNGWTFFISIITINHFIIVLLAYASAFFAFRTYRTIVRLANLYSALRVVIAVFSGGILSYLLSMHVFTLAHIPRSVYLIQMLLLAPLCVLSRFSFRIFDRIKSNNNGIPTLIYGAGNTTDKFLPTIMRELPELLIVGIIDDDPFKQGSEVQGIKVFGGRKFLPKIVRNFKIKQVILAIPSASGNKLREIVDLLHKMNLKIKILPSPESFVNEINSQRITDMRDLNIEDLLRRPSRNIDKSAIQQILTNKTVLVTGGGGSIGSELVRQIALMAPGKLIINDASEFALYKISEELSEKFPTLSVVSHLGSLAHETTAKHLFAAHNINVVFHACAYKHVPLVEDNICVAILNNILSAKNVFSNAVEHQVDRVILISSDKAVRPTNVMGATKRMCELLALWYAKNQGIAGKCAFSAVRFGNVLGSSGSVIPKFMQQINAGGPVTITHPDITRFFMLIPEAVSLVLQAATASKSGEIFVLNMGSPIKIVDMAKDLIRIMGKRESKDIEIVFTGLRPGEKLYEELLLDSESITQVSEDFFLLNKVVEPEYDFQKTIDEIVQLSYLGKNMEAKKLLFQIVQQHEVKIIPQNKTKTADLAFLQPIEINC